MANGTQNPAPAAYDAVAFHPSLPGGKSSGRLLLSCAGAVFEADAAGHSGQEWPARIVLPIAGLQVSMGGAADRLIFFAHPAAEGWTIYTGDKTVLRDPALGALHGLALQVGALRGRRRAARLLALALLLAVLAAVAALVLSKDLLVKAAAARIPYSLEKQIGVAVFERLKPTFNLVDSPPLQRALAGLAAPLARAAEGGRYDVRVYVQRSAEVNAFALPGGTIVFTTGLLLAAGGYDEVSGVLAHELAHVTCRHAMRRLIESIGLFAIVQAAVGDVSGLVAVLASQGGQLLDLKYSRDLEREADDKGFDTLLDAGLSPAGMMTFFEKLQAEQEKRGDAAGQYLGLLSTHPATRARIDHLRVRLAAAPRPRRPAAPPALDFKSFQALLNP